MDETKLFALAAQYRHENSAIVNGSEAHDIVYRLVELCNDHGHSGDPPVLAQMGASFARSQEFGDTFSSLGPDYTSWH